MTFTMKVSGAPPALFIMDHQCFSCEHRWELTLERAADHGPIFGEYGELIGKCCPNCGRFNTAPTDGTRSPPITIVRGNHDFSERERERLWQRSNEHYRREGKDEAIENQRAVFRQQGVESDDKVAEVVV